MRTLRSIVFVTIAGLSAVASVGCKPSDTSDRPATRPGTNSPQPGGMNKPSPGSDSSKPGSTPNSTPDSGSGK